MTRGKEGRDREEGTEGDMEKVRRFHRNEIGRKRDRATECMCVFFLCMCVCVCNSSECVSVGMSMSERLLTCREAE